MLHCYLNDCIIYIDAILHENADDVDIAIKLCLYCMRTQIFNDGNKLASVIIANHFMITKGQVLLAITQNCVSEFTCLPAAYYEDRDNGEIMEYMRSCCWQTF